jgi:HlyD family secretion protein
MAIAGGLLLIAAAAVVSLRRAEENGAPVYAAEVERQDLVQIVSGSGRVQPIKEVSISASVSGRITEMPVRSGDHVDAGDLLVRLEPTRYEAAVAEAEAALATARTQVDLAQANLRQARAEYVRIEKLAAGGLVSAADRDAALATRDVRLATLAAARNDVQRAQAGVDRARDDLAKTTMLAPIGAEVTRVLHETGEMALGADFKEDVILVLADLGHMEVRFEVDENDIVNVAIGDSAAVEVDAFPDSSLAGRVREIAASATNRGSGALGAATVFEVKADLLQTPKGLRPGMSASVDLFTEFRQGVVAVPIQAITARSAATLAEWGLADTTGGDPDEQTNDNELREIAFVIEDGVAHCRPVKTGIMGETELEILSGLDAGEQIVTGPYRLLSQELADQQKVRVDDVADGKEE